MFGKKTKGIFFLLGIFFITDQFALASDNTINLEPIVIRKEEAVLTQNYSLKSSDIDNLTFNSPIEALNNLPVDLQSRSPKGGIQTDFSLRGSNFQGVLILLDGQRINDPQTGHFNSDLPQTKEDIEKIEVMPGVGSSLFGPDAIGGAINFVTKPPDKPKMVLELSGGQYSSHSEMFSVTERSDSAGLRVSIENDASSGFRYDTEFKKFTAALNSRINFSEHEFKINLGYQDKEFGAYDFYTPGMGFPSQEQTRTWLIDSGFKLDALGMIIKPNFLWRRHDDKFMLDKTQTRSRYLNHHRNDIFTPNVYFQKDTGFLGRLGLGFEYGREQIKSTNLGKHARNHGSIFMDDLKEINSKVSLSFSGRLDNFDSFGSNGTGSGALKFNLTPRDALHLGVSRSIRIPTFTELYYSDPTSVGNPNLSADKALNYETGYEYKKDGVSFSLTGFLRQEDDFMDWVKHSPAQLRWRAENIAGAQLWGLETNFKLKLNSFFTASSSYTYIDRQADDSGLLYKYGPTYSKHMANAALIFDLPLFTQSFSLNYKKKPGRGGWLTLNTHLSYNFYKYAQVFVEVDNMLSKEYEEIPGIPQPKRWVEGGVRFEW